jgi:hypothetical protein
LHFSDSRWLRFTTVPAGWLIYVLQLVDVFMKEQGGEVQSSKTWLKSAF